MAGIGYGDYSPRTPNERILGIGAMNISSILFGYIIGNIGSVIEKHTEKIDQRRDLIVNTNNFMHANKLAFNVKRKVRQYINYMFADSKNRVNLRELLVVLSQPLKEEIYSHINGDAILSLKCFKDISTKLVSRISRILWFQVNSPHEFIFTEGESSLSMYFITKGCIEILDERSQSSIKFLSDNGYFGEIGLFTDKNRCASVITVSFLETLCLTSNELKILSCQFPEMNRKLEFLRENTLGGDLTVLHVVCYLCQSIGHISRDCKKMVEREKLQEKWINNRRESQLINPEDYRANKKFHREYKNFRVKELTSQNV